MITEPAKNSTATPLSVDVWRGDMVESRHLVNAIVTDNNGKVVYRWGDNDSPVYLRSAIKPIQALPLVESGAADAFKLSETELSLACASHTGEEIHVNAVTNWLSRMGLSIDDLECGVHWPTYKPAERALFLATSVHLKEDHRGYIHLKHNVQQRLIKVLQDFTDLDLTNAPKGIDGCSIPTIGIPLLNSAMAIARFADPSGLSTDRAKACARIQKAIAAAPEMIAGSDRLCTALNGSAEGKVIAKVGAEGVYLAALPTLGYGIALKTVDGTTRGAEVALGFILEKLGLMTEKMHAEMDAFILPDMTNWNKYEIGKLRIDPHNF
jgi:L-asparaginase II